MAPRSDLPPPPHKRTRIGQEEEQLRKSVSTLPRTAGDSGTPGPFKSHAFVCLRKFSHGWIISTLHSFLVVRIATLRSGASGVLRIRCPDHTMEHINLQGSVLGLYVSVCNVHTALVALLGLLSSAAVSGHGRRGS